MVKTWIIDGKPSFVPASDWAIVTQLCSHYNVNPYVIAAIGWHETHWGTLGAGRQGYHLGVGVPNDFTQYKQFQGVYAQVNWAAKKIRDKFRGDVSYTSLYNFSAEVWKNAGTSSWATSIFYTYSQLMAVHKPSVTVPPMTPLPAPPDQRTPMPDNPDTVPADKIGDILNINLGNWGVFNGVRNLIQAYVVNPVQNAMNHTYNWVRDQVGGTSNYWLKIKQWWNKMVAVFEVFIHKIYETFSNQWNKLQRVTTTYWNMMVQFFDTWAGRLIEMIGTRYYLLAKLTGGLFNKIDNLFTYWYNGLSLMVDDWWTKIQDFFGNQYSKARILVVEWWEMVARFFSIWYERLWLIVESHWGKVVEFFTTLYPKARALVVDYYSKLYKFVTDYYNRFLLVVEVGWHEIKAFLENPVEYFKIKVKAAIKAVIDWVFNELIAFVNRIW